MTEETTPEGRPGPEQHAATVRRGILPPHAASNRFEHQAALAALDELVALAGSAEKRAADSHEVMTRVYARAEAAEAALRLVAEQPHAPADGAASNGAVHVYVQGHPMGCPICEAIEKGLA